MKSIIAAVSAFCVGIASRARTRVPAITRGAISFSRDLTLATVNVPREMWRWWKSAHTLTPYLQGGKINHEAGRHDQPGSSSARDYVLWNRLGLASDGMLMVIAFAVFMLIAIAVF